MSFEQSKKNIALGYNSLIILVGVSGSGKSTFAKKNFSESTRVSTDECRRLICGSHFNQRVSDDAFEVFYTIIDKRLKNGYPTIADSTALKRKYRQRLTKLAEKYKFNTVLVLFDLPLQVCIDQDKKRKNRAVGEQVITRQHKDLQKTKVQLEQEQYDQVIIYNDVEQTHSSHFRYTHPNVEKNDLGPFDIISSIDGCYNELQKLLGQLEYQKNHEGIYYHYKRRKIVILGDICTKGPHNIATFQLVYDMCQNNCAYYLPGDECEKLYNYFRNNDTAIQSSLEPMIRELEKLSDHQKSKFVMQFEELYEKSPVYLILADGELVVSHAGILGKWIGQLNKKIQSFCIHGSAHVDDWYKNYYGKSHIVYGHPHTETACWKNHTININLNVVCGGQLCALRYPEKQIVAVDANQKYYEAKN
ncbi:AAA family ATPase [Candidatus Uabimicrobium sp. HlEnr_7]|uniref:AAA family ATPase n=1 Tax=Candidatus Uabimicrobium helgolandensis TaxID=3095367 RepID=UPI003558AF00